MASEVMDQGFSDRGSSWLPRALALLDDPSGWALSRDAALAAVGHAVSMRTDRFVLLDGPPGPWRVAALGPGAAPEDGEWARRAVRGEPPGHHESWVVIGSDLDEFAVALGEATAASDLAAILPSFRWVLRALRHERAAREAENGVEALRSVAGRILRTREVGEALLAVTNETLSLLGADIAGVMLRDGDEIFMRSCAGNQVADTAQLRMRKGQGLAGLVFATGQAETVDDYLNSEIISSDFHGLARREQTRSATAAPLIVNEEVVGVLEVWRREKSPFTPTESRRLVALAELAAIALDNAQLHALSETSIRAVETARQSMERQLGRVEHALRVQQELIEALVDGAPLPAIFRIIGQRLSCQVTLLGLDLEPVASWPPDGDPGPLAEAARQVRSATGDEGHETHWAECDDGVAVIRKVRAGQEQIGWLCLQAKGSAERDEVELAARQASLTVALHHLEEQAALRARASQREEMLLHLIRGSPDERHATISRARYLRVDLRGPLRVAVCRLEGLQVASRGEAWSEGYEDRMRRKLLLTCESALTESGDMRLVAITGNDIIALIRSQPSDRLHATLADLAGSLGDQLPVLHPLWGVSSERPTAHDLVQAFHEAMAAIQALRLDSVRQVAVFEDLGILGLLIAGPQGMALIDFARTTLGSVLRHDEQNGTPMVDTLRTYLDTSCNQRKTASRMMVHEKTVKYRLEVIQRLTGLRLSEHRDRMRADIAIRAIDLN